MSQAWLPLLGVTVLLAIAPPDFEPAPAYVPLFTPARLPPGAFAAFVSRRNIDEVLAWIRDGATGRQLPPGSFEAEALPPLDAFGLSGGYNRWTLARLYGARRARVARGPRLANGRVVEAWTLVSPYPDPSLQRLEPGTLLIVLRLEPAAADGMAATRPRR